MALNCKTCGTALKDRKNLYCPRHAAALLIRLEKDGYLVPLVISTSDGHSQRVSPRRFLTLQDEATIETSD